MSLSTFNRSNVAVMLVLVGAVLALFFLPEIIDLQRAISGSGAAKREAKAVAGPVAESSEVAIDTVAAPTQLSPLEEVLMLLDSGREGRARAMIPVSAELPALSEQGSMDPVETQGIIKSFGESPLTWKAIQSESSMKELRRARKEALELAKELGPESPNTRFALFNFASGLSAAIDPKTASFIKPIDVVSYLEELDLAVSRNMSREPIDRAEYLAWANISLGPVFEATRLGQREKNYTVPFNPRLTLTSVFVTHNKPDSPERLKRYPVTAVVSGFVRGNDVRTLWIMSPSGEVHRRISLKKPSKQGGYKFFRTPALDGRKDWRFVVEGVQGERSEKTYRFYERARRFPWGIIPDIRVRGYQAPFRNAVATGTTFSVANVDRRLDSYYVVGDIEGQSSNEVFQSF